ncbi:DMT family transporter [Pelagibacterium lacus]|uniref:DMT family transporter n=1 Tax=Pelagibacterium lacus TaxID=2282655 RepID=A0A369WB01_9HYPH|nr:DMT family transporter [Pelagibacterium lacus]RDE10482.1 DMT family transporter [Pelagibacterium lacus]
MSSLVTGHQDRRLYAIGLALVTYAFFTVCDTSAKWMAVSGMPPLQVAFGRYAVQFAFILGMVLPKAGLSSFRTRRPVLQVIRALGLLGMTAFNFLAVVYLPLTMTSAILFCMPLMITALSVPFLGEHVGWRRWLAILVGFAGILIVIQPWGADFHWAVFLSLGSAASGAMYYIFTRKLTATETTLSLQLYTGLVGTVCLAPFAVAVWMWPEGLLSWIVFLAVGLSAMTGHGISIIAHRYAPASVLAPFAYSQIVWMTISGWLVFSELPTVWLFIGGPIVIGSGLYIWLRERTLARASVSPISPAEAEQRTDVAPAP